MKRIISILLTLLLCLTVAPALPTAEAASDVTVNAANFPDAVFRSYVSANCDADRNGVLSASEIAAVTEIDVHSMDVSSLRGVERFPALENLNCNGNRLTELDLSKNTALNRLSCGSNELTSLDLRANTALKILYCFGNQLTALDLGDNRVITDLHCQNNALPSLDVSRNTALKVLDCGYNRFTSLDVRANRSLETIACLGNQLTVLDLSNNEGLTYLDCSGNQLTALDISNNEGLEYLYCSGNPLTILNVTAHTALTQLRCAGNALTELDLTKNEALEYLDCSDNALTALALEENMHLYELHCGGNPMETLELCDHAELMTLDVSDTPTMKSLDCDSNELTSLDISGCPALETLSCLNNELTSLDIGGCPALIILDCQKNALTSLDIGGCPALHALDCGNNALTSLDVTCCPALDTLECGSNQLTKLDVSGNPKLENFCCDNNRLTKLDLSENPDLMYLNCQNNRLTKLDLSHNRSMWWVLCDGNDINALDISANAPLLDAYLKGDREECHDNGDYVKYTYDYAWVPNVLSVDFDTVIYTESTAPVITTQPHDITAKIGDTAVFKVAATGNDLTYQWQYYTGSKWVDSGLTGNKTAAQKVPVTAARNGQQYRCVVSNGATGVSVFSTAVKLYAKINITAQPKDIAAKVGETAKFTVTATGAGLKYQWQYYTGSKWANSGMTGNKTAALSVPVTVARNGQKYRCVITDANGKTATSNAAKLTAKPAITTQPADKSAKVGETVKFTVKAEGVNITYRWQYRTSSTGTWKNSGATGCSTATLSIEATAARNGYQYRCVVEDANGNKAISNAATLTIKPAITTQPKSATAAAGATVNFTVKATGAGLTYRWQYKAPDGTWKNSGATGYNTATLTVKPTAGMNGYQYRCVIVDANGTKLISSAATLTVK